VSKEFKVGLIAIVAGVILYLGFNFLKGIDFFSPVKKYYALYDNVDGLIVSNPVIVNGYSVGRVSRIAILQEKEYKILVEMDVDEALVLGDSTTATLANSDFLGSKAIILDINEITVPLEDKDTLISVVDKGLSELLASAQPITDNLSITIRRINEILLGLQGSGEKINTTLDELNGTLGGVNRLIAQNEASITLAISEFSQTMVEVKERIASLDPIINKSGETLDKINALELEQTLKEVSALLATMNQTVESINNGEGTVGKIMTDDDLYNNLNQAMLDLDSLLVHFNQYPKHFMAPLGKSHKKVQKDLSKN
jgi:phospholipid/cholesterol/gamma-HCH transport system substrate-binding protein